MESEQSEPSDELFYRDSQWIVENGGYLHGNNVLYYFAQSPFFDRQSNNNSIFLQAVSDPRFATWLATRENFEAQLSRIAGTEYVVTYDPIASDVRDKTGQVSSVWVIQKQTRRKIVGREDEVTPRTIYYIVGDAVYQAPTIAKLIGNRMGIVATPMPDDNMTSNSQPVKSKTSPATTSYEDTRNFLDALSLSQRFGKEYMDEVPLFGEPGNFRMSRVREAPVKPAETVTEEKQLSMPAKEKSPPSAAPPPIRTDLPQVSSKKSAKGIDKSPTTPGGGRDKPKRRKSRPITTPTES